MARKKQTEDGGVATLEAPDKPRQQVLPGTEDEYDAKLDELAYSYHEAKTERQRASQIEKDAKNDLRCAMIGAEKSYYRSKDGIKCRLNSKYDVATEKDGEANE